MSNMQAMVKTAFLAVVAGALVPIAAGGGGAAGVGPCDTTNLGDNIWPTCSMTPPAQSSPFGPRQMASEAYRYDWHRGVDIPIDFGSPVYAVADGTVRLAGDYDFYSDTLVQIRHGDSSPYLYSNYMHLSGVAVAEDDPITVGDLIGYSGESASGFDHIHLEFRDGCVYQECNRNPWGYLPYVDEPPAIPALRGANLTSTSGTILLLEASTPADQLDLDGLDLAWGVDSVQLSFDGINATTPSDWPEALDHPLVNLEGTVQACLFPERFSTSYTAADYRLAFSGLDASVTGGSAALRDPTGPGPSVTLTPLLAPMDISPATQHVDALPGATVVLSHTLENNGSQPLNLTLSAQSAQSAPLTLSHTSLTLDPGTSQVVTLMFTLSSALPLGIGDCIILEVATGTGLNTIALDSVTVSDVPTPTPVPTNSPEVTLTPTITPSPMGAPPTTGGPTVTSTPTATAVPTPTPIDTPGASATSTPEPTSAPPPMYAIKGDVDCDHDVDAVDGLRVLRYVGGLSDNLDEPCTDIGIEAGSVFGDTDCDEDMDSVDALNILRYVAAFATNLPADCPPFGG